MTLKTSSNKFNPFAGMYISTIRKNLGLLLLSVAAVLLVSPGYLMVLIGNALDYDESPYFILNEFIPIITTALAIIGALGIFTYNMINTAYLYSKKSSDVFHSLPLNRNGLLLSRSLASLTLVAIPITVAFLGIMLVTIIEGFFVAFIFEIALDILYIFISLLMLWALSLVFAVCAGTAFDYILSFAGVNLGLLFISLIVDSIMDSYLFGYVSTGPLINMFSPVYYSISKVYRFSKSDELFPRGALTFIIINLLFTAILAGLAFLLYNRRKAEKSGTAYAFKFIYIICGIILAFCGAYVIGYTFSDGEVNSAVYWVFACAGALISAIAYGAISERGFKGYKGSAVLGIISALLLAGVFLSAKCDIFGYGTKIPVATEINSVTLDGPFSAVDFKDPSLALKLHKKIVANKDAIKYYEDQGDSTYSGIFITYNLKNGKVMKRHYFVNDKKYESDLNEIAKSKERFNNIYNDLDFYSPNTLDFYAGYKSVSGEQVNVYTYITAAEFRNLISIYQAELDQTDKFVWEQNGTSFGADWYKNREGFSVGPMCFDDSFKNTIAYLDSLNLKLRAEETDGKTILVD